VRIAVVGLGKMGSALAARLLEGGNTVAVWNRSRPAVDHLIARGACGQPDLASVWRDAAAVLTFLSDDRAVHEVCLGPDGLLNTAPPEALLIEMSTISPEASALVAAEAARRGVGYLRSPVSGNPEVLASGNLTLIVSGESTALARARPILELIGPNILYVGGAEQARVMKLAVNAMLAATAQMLAEVITLCEACDMDRSTVLDVLGRSVVGSPFVRYKTAALVERQYRATFTTAMLLKDLRLAAGVAEPVGVHLPVTELITTLTADACEQGLSDLDFIALLAYVQRLANREPDVPMAPLGARSGRE
jgi:3-hydroxyisobutyrate dehydrogenase-like beta-hydroxyacid dehydrogenase